MIVNIEGADGLQVDAQKGLRKGSPHSSVPRQAAPWPQELGGNISHHSNRLCCLSCLRTLVSTLCSPGVGDVQPLAKDSHIPHIKAEVYCCLSLWTYPLCSQWVSKNFVCVPGKK